ncbi:MAG TPA: hypothetical protein VFJ72_03745 [Rubrobacteraceae bacterium]|nr:hypothetical protein [Rubrobacteraceae bacterium]
MAESGILSEADRVEFIEGEVVEVFKTLLDYDVEVKVPLYARARIPEVWIVGLFAGEIYQSVERLRREELTSSAVPGLTVQTGDIFG